MLGIKRLGMVAGLLLASALTTGCANSSVDNTAGESQDSENTQVVNQPANHTNNQTNNNQSVPSALDKHIAKTNQGKGACGKLSQEACLNSAECVVQQNADGRGYFCRANENRCEMGFVQSEGKQSCKTGNGCYFSPGSCYCPPGVQCVCGGGKPPSCGLNAQNSEIQ